MRRRRAERARRRRADDVGELVAAFAQPRREQLDAIVVALDVIEAAALPPGEPVAATLSLRVLLRRERRPPTSRTTIRPARSRRAADR